ncbi:MAG: hypothetical protein IPJ13_21020 [Saprospiraceae bacterium]|nr:hypothetical protein [Saprospiraceae bacterium]
MKSLINFFSVLVVTFFVTSLSAQIQFSKSYDQTGINQFEPTKVDDVAYNGFKLNIGGSFRQGYQLLKHENATGKSALYPLGNGFNLAAANLNFDIQLGDGIRIFLENYMASRHHNEFWVKGGYIQIDKLPMFNNPDWYTKYFRVRIGHMEVNYGDTHFRRSDGGNAIFNPFADNNIMDEFATEIGGEIYVYPVDGFMAMVGLTNGLIRNNVRDYDRLPVIGTGKVDSLKVKNPSIVLKAAYDKTMSDFKLRLSASLYHNNSSPSLTLFGGDRTGSAYFGVLEAAASTNGTAEAFSGRFNPGLSNKLTAVIFNPFLKYKGIEFLGTYESAKGKTVNESPGSDRKTTQVAAEVVYRFLKNEQVFVGFKYNTVTSRLSGYTTDVDITRTSFAAGWFPTKNLLLKGELVNQKYEGFKTTDLRNGGKFNGLVIEAVVGF